jgi:FkbM family methyltransferase
MNDDLHRRCSSLGLAIAHAAEVGVYLPETSNVLGFAAAGVRTTLVEADPQTVEKIEAHFRGRHHVTVINRAVADRVGPLTLYRAGSSTFAGDLPSSPARENDLYVPDPDDSFTVEAVTFDRLDDGTIDLLSVDVEGGEWFVLKHLVSRPRVISVETHGKRYLNPYLAEISRWMKANGYRIWYRGRSDTVYLRAGILPEGPLRSVGLALSALRLGLRRLLAIGKHRLRRALGFA